MFNKYLLNYYNVPDTALGMCNTTVKRRTVKTGRARKRGREKKERENILVGEISQKIPQST